MSREEHHDRDDWETCPTGEIARMVDRRRATDRARRLRTAAAAGGALVLCIGLIAGWMLTQRSHVYGGITCRECLAHGEDFVAGRIEDGELRASVRTHFEECPKCKPHLEELRESSADAGGSVVGVAVAARADVSDHR